jgi:uncharacterized metal-binding protein YceD (DUF177 family)
MSKRKTKPDVAARSPWRVLLAVSDVPEGGLHLDLTPDERERYAIAALAGLARLPRLEASFDVTRHGHSGLHVVGRVSATVGQTCVVTLDPMENEVDEAVDLVFVPQPQAARHKAPELEVPFEDAPEPLVDGMVDLGAITTEFLILGIDPYPRKPGTLFQAAGAGDDDNAHPFAALSALKKERGDRRS